MSEAVVARRAERRDSEYIETALREGFGGTAVAVHDELIELADTAAVVAESGGRPVGLLTYREDGAGGWEVVALLATQPGSGAGTVLLEWLGERARQSGIQRLWLITTNDNTRALRFYQRRGFDLVRINRGGVDRSRALKPSIPLHNDGIAIRHELELELFPANAE